MTDPRYSPVPTDEPPVGAAERRHPSTLSSDDDQSNPKLENPFNDLKEETVLVVDKLADIPPEYRNSSASEDDDETTAKKEKRAKLFVYCMKSYCVIFVIFIISLTIYMTADRASSKRSESTVTSGVGSEEEVTDGLKTGYVQLRLNKRKVYYRMRDPEGMANHTVLLIHDEDQTGEVFVKMGTMKFLSEHGAKAVAIDNVGAGKSDPPLHLLDDYSDFYDEVLELLSLKYNLIIACLGRGCDTIFSYYVEQGVYNPDNSFIEGAIFTSPQGNAFAKYIVPARAKLTAQVATKTVVVNGDKDEYFNLYVNGNLTLLPRTQIHSLPNLKNNFYRQPKYRPYFHAALEAFIEGVDYTYDMDIDAIYKAQQRLKEQQSQYFQNNLQNPGAFQNNFNAAQNQVPLVNQQLQNNRQLIQQQFQNAPQQQYQNVPQQQYQNIQQLAPNQQPNYNVKQNPNGMKNLFDTYRAKQKFEDTSGYDPAHRFSNIKGKKLL